MNSSIRTRVERVFADHRVVTLAALARSAKLEPKRARAKLRSLGRAKPERIRTVKQGLKLVEQMKS